MPEGQEEEIINESSDLETLALEKNEEEKIAKLEYQKYITSTEELKNIFLIGLCGYYYAEEEEKIEFAGVKTKNKKRILKKDESKAFCNENCAYYLYSQLMPLIHQLTTTSNFSDKNIFVAYNSKITTLIFSLLDNYYYEGNTFGLKIQYLPDIISFLCSFQLVSMKGKEGFTLKQIAQTYISLFKTEEKPREEGKGLFGIFKK